MAGDPPIAAVAGEGPAQPRPRAVDAERIDQVLAAQIDGDDGRHGGSSAAATTLARVGAATRPRRRAGWRIPC
jgi:hypothetical protein